MAVSKSAADRASWIAAATVGLVAVFFLLVLPLLRYGSVVPTQSRQTITHETSKVTKPNGGATITDTAKTEAPAATSFLDRAFAGSESVWLLRLAGIALLVFVSAALTQRVLLADYQLSFAGFEIPALDAAEVITAVKKVEGGFPPVADISLPTGAAAALQATPLFMDVGDARMQFLAFRLELEARLRRVAQAYRA